VVTTALVLLAKSFVQTRDRLCALHQQHAQEAVSLLLMDPSLCLPLELCSRGTSPK
jgi:hypothetical protein